MNELPTSEIEDKEIGGWTMQSYKNGSNTDNIVPHRTLGGNRIG